MRRIVLLSWCLVLTATAGGGVWGAQHIAATSHSSNVAPGVASVPPDDDSPLASGRVVAVNLRDGRLTIAHRGVERLHIEPGTGIFHVQDPALLSGLTPGDKVRFDVERDGRRYAIVRLENAN